MRVCLVSLFVAEQILLISMLEVQYGLARGAKVIGVDTGDKKRQLISSFGAQFIDVSLTNEPDETMY